MKIINAFFRLSDPGARICSSNRSDKANKIYLENRYLPRKVCGKPCTEMLIRLLFQSRFQSNDSSVVNFVLYPDIEVLEEVMPKTHLMLYAEIGGYLGLTLGVSLLDLNFVLSSLFYFVKMKSAEYLSSNDDDDHMYTYGKKIADI